MTGRAGQPRVAQSLLSPGHRRVSNPPGLGTNIRIMASAQTGPAMGAGQGDLISVRGLSHAYSSSGGSLSVLRELRLQVKAGMYIALTGESGQGKSTLLALLGGLQPAQCGELVVAGHDLRRLSSGGMARFRSRTIGFVFQHHGLVESLTAVENVALAAQLNGLPRRDAVARARDLLGAIGLLDREGHLPGRLSGGERQRVAVARAMVNRPALILADEPTGNLDERNAQRVMELIEMLRQQYGATLLVVTHDSSLASRADTMLRLREGGLEAA